MKYSKEEEYIIKKYYPKYGGTGEKGCVERIKRATGNMRTRRGVALKAMKLGVKYEGENKGVFKKGFTPHNKGKKMSEDLKQKVSKTWFKKGHLPHNTKEDGVISVRHHKRAGVYYFYIRLSVSNWQLLQRYVYEKHHNVTLGEGEVIRFKDGNLYNFAPDNLQKVTRFQHLLLNNPRVNVPNDKDILNAYDTLNNLNKRLKQLEDGTE